MLFYSRSASSREATGTNSVCTFTVLDDINVTSLTDRVIQPRRHDDGHGYELEPSRYTSIHCDIRPLVILLRLFLYRQNYNYYL